MAAQSVDQRFWNAVSEGEAEEVRRILAKNPGLDVNRKFEEGPGGGSFFRNILQLFRYTDKIPLHCACAKGHASVVSVLLARRGIDVNLKDQGNTALMRACAEGHASVVSLLLAHPEVDVNLKDNDGNTPFKRACDLGRASCVQVLLKDPRVEVSEPDNGGSTPFMSACAKDLDAIVSLLLAHPEVDVNLEDNDGDTPFQRACGSGRTSCVRLLLKDSRVKVNEPNNGGYTPLRIAAGKRHLDVIKWWIASGREINLGKLGNEETDAIGAASPRRAEGESWSNFQERKRQFDPVASLLQNFETDSAKTRRDVRKELRIAGQWSSVQTD